jgi:hypothetical protein
MAVPSFTIFGFIEDGERTPKPVFRSIFVKWHLVHRLQL